MPNLLDLLKYYISNHENKPGQVYLSLIHRLDRCASGLLVLARNTKAASRLNEQFRNNTVTKLYLCIVRGSTPLIGRCHYYISNTRDEPQSYNTTSTTPSDNNTNNDQKVLVSDICPTLQKSAPEGYYEARLRYRTLGQLEDGFSVLEVTLERLVQSYTYIHKYAYVHICSHI